MTIPLGSGLGAFGAGEGPAGHDPEDELEAALQQEPVAALEFDPEERVYVIKDDNTMAGTSPVIQRATLLMMPLGSIGAVATDGLDIKRIKRAGPESRQSTLEDALRRAWKVLIDAGQLRMGNVVVKNPGPPWTGEFEVEVIDLTTKQTATLESVAR